MVKLSKRVAISLMAPMACVSTLIASGATLTPQAYGESSRSTERGFDACHDPSLSHMQTWWNSSPYYNIFLYIGGANEGCDNSHVTSGYVKDIQGDGSYNMYWAIVPIWVGRQMPYPDCQNHTTYNSYISQNSSTAYSQGVSSAQSAFAKLGNLGFDLNGTPVVLDLEAPIPNTGNCASIAKAYVRGWNHYLQEAPAQKAGIYTSSGGGHLNQFWTISPRSNFAWFAEEMTPRDPDVYHSSYLDASYWSNHQRHKQYDLSNQMSFGGFTDVVDQDCSDGPVYWPNQELGTGYCTS